MVGILRTLAGMANRQPARPPGFRDRPERVVLPARGDAAAAKPPVRIFVGTEPGQHRAERVFIWSIEQVRDPSRHYEIHLMADLRGFDRRRWLTGFTNYRFTIPHFAGGCGRAIYNDVDQIYLADPAELFDADMGSRGFLALTARDTSVMLIDCARMAPIWTLDLARRLRRNKIERATRAAGELWGPLAPEWNARDEEYTPGRSKVLHFTTIHTQPWQPFPERFVYQHNPVGEVWLAMERAADAAGYEVFTATRPSAAYADVIDRPAASSAAAPAIEPEGLGELLAGAHIAEVLDVRMTAHERPMVAAQAGRRIKRLALAAGGIEALPARGSEAVVCAGVLDQVPEGDVPWLLEALFRTAGRCLYLSGSVAPAGRLADRRPRPVSWWMAHVEHAAARHPHVRWKLVVHRARGRGQAPLVREGGRRLDGRQPAVWVLTDHKAGHATQSVGLAEAVGFPYEIKRLQFNVLNHFSHRVRGASRLGVNIRRSAPLGPPWPDLVISTGRRTAPVARWIGAQSGGQARLVQLGRRGGETPDAFDLVVACAHFRLPLHPRRMEIIAPLNAITAERLERAAARWQGLVAGAPRPRIVLVAGGTCARHRLDAATATCMGTEVAAWAQSLGGSLFAITSPRTGAAATAALRDALAGRGRLHEWTAGEADNPYVGYLALADAIVVTGESESMLAEAAAAGKPLFIYPLPRRPLGIRRLAEWVARQAAVRPRKAKGRIRPQQRLEHLCARLIEAGLVRPPRHLEQLHQGLIAAGAARMFGAPLDAAACRPLREAEAVAQRVRRLLGWTSSVAPVHATRLSPATVSQLAVGATARPRPVADDAIGEPVHAARR